MSAAVRGRTVRHVQHVMGMPISLAMRGRHAADGTGRAAWTEAMAVLRAVDHVFSTYRADSVVSRLGRGDLRLADCPSEVAEVLELGATAERDSGGAVSCYRPGRDGRIAFDPSGVVKGWAAERAAGALRELAGTDFCLYAGGDIVSRTLDPDDPPWRIGIEDPADIDGTAAYARGEDAARWLQTRHGRTGLVIWADGSTSPVRGPAEG